MNNRALFLTLTVSAVLGCLFTLAEYKLQHGGDPLTRLGYGVFVSVLPALAAFVVLKLTNFSVVWRGAVRWIWATAALIYLLLFLLLLFVSGFLAVSKA